MRPRPSHWSGATRKCRRSPSRRIVEAAVGSSRVSPTAPPVYIASGSRRRFRWPGPQCRDCRCPVPYGDGYRVSRGPVTPNCERDCLPARTIAVRGQAQLSTAVATGRDVAVHPFPGRGQRDNVDRAARRIALLDRDRCHRRPVARPDFAPAKAGAHAAHAAACFGLLDLARETRPCGFRVTLRGRRGSPCIVIRSWLGLGPVEASTAMKQSPRQTDLLAASVRLVAAIGIMAQTSVRWYTASSTTHCRPCRIVRSCGAVHNNPTEPTRIVGVVFSLIL